MNKDIKQQYTLRITQANSSQMVVIIYDILLDYLKEARTLLESQSYGDYSEAIRRCTACIRELIGSINQDSSLAGNLLSLYIYCNKELSKSELHKSSSELDHVEMVISKLRDAFNEVALKDNALPIMGNTPEVYAGLTYGKESLVVHLNQDSNRGYKV